MNLKELHKIMCDAYGIDDDRNYIIDEHNNVFLSVTIELSPEDDTDSWIKFIVPLIPNPEERLSGDDTKLIIDTTKYINISTCAEMFENIVDKIKIIPSVQDINRFFKSNFFCQFETIYSEHANSAENISNLDNEIYEITFLDIMNQPNSNGNKQHSRIMIPWDVTENINSDNKFFPLTHSFIDIVPFIGDWRKNDPVGYEMHINLKRDITREDIDHFYQIISTYMKSREDECEEMGKLSSGKHLSVYQSGSHKITVRIVL